MPSPRPEDGMAMLETLNLVRPVIVDDALVLASVICVVGGGIASVFTISSAQEIKHRDRSKEKKIFRIGFLTRGLRGFTLIF